MSFQPIIQVTKVPRASVSFFFIDNTPTYPTSNTGWGAPNAPTAPGQITSVWGEVQPYGAPPIEASDVAGDIAVSCEVVVPVRDGVDMFHVYYGQAITATYTVNLDRTILTVTEDMTVFDGITSLSPDGSFPVRIKTISGNTIVLEKNFPGTSTTYTSIFRYWHAQQRLLVLNCTEGTIVNKIAVLPLQANNCESSQDILDMIMTKLGAEIAFNCGNYAKAHEAALLVCGMVSSKTQNCSTCG